jgi:hypothetical protein
METGARPPSARSCIPHLPVDIDGHKVGQPGCVQLLALYQMRRCLERVADADAGNCQKWMAMTALEMEIVRELRELIAALDRRTPYVERAGEAAIARDAASLKARALKRIEALELEAAFGRPRGAQTQPD